MLDGLFMLLSLSVVMALASFFAGALPLSMTLSPSQLRLVSMLGMGVLVGTSLIVIIPEGIEAVYTVGPAEGTHKSRQIRSCDTAVYVRWAADMPSGTAYGTGHSNRVRAPSPPQMDAFDALPGPVLPTHDGLAIDTTSTSTSADKPPSEEETPPADAEQHHEQDPPTFYVGLSLILGFVLMFLIDKLPRHASDNLQPAAPPRHISLNNLSQGLHPDAVESVGDEESEGFLQSLTPSPKQTRSLATTTGLVIHAAADGIAMGASASTANVKLGFIIFIAILIHKAPAAFGLTSVLLKQGLSKRAARGHLIVFSLAAPVGALSTWLLVHIIGGGGTIDGESGQWWTGMLLLFSAGTFLYVAMHAMQEEGSGHDHALPNGYSDGGLGAQRKQARPQIRDTFAAVLGMLIPLLTQFGHHH
ncbi:MAG: hypothetical protein M1818_003695 [Claussenomyces sp. TS43310]|nr:MAG: hypothetical protein M1818_003695 [Claussenomyces sp. TS43310]